MLYITLIIFVILTTAGNFFLLLLSISLPGLDCRIFASRGIFCPVYLDRALPLSEP